ncbi:MAG: hypothetical protein A2V70_12100 [Planctomycetes bacterium RBG_13_63_9]|nr:MAG: hypothetical protein A2V70_12100 [Planctomycetes bacterium RBG_13_63_9]
MLLAWGGLAAWQRHEYLHERELAQDTLHQQAHSVMYALVGGIRAHRRLGQFFEEQLQGALDELVKSQDVLAVTITDADAKVLLSAGKKNLLVASSADLAGDFWDPPGFRLVERFTLPPSHGGQGAGPGGGPPWGRGRRWRLEGNTDAESRFSAGGIFAATLLLDRTRADAQCRRAAWLRTWVVAASGLLLLCLALAWRATVRLAEAHGHARLLQSEARHLSELSQAAAGLAHETRNPLGLIRGWTQRLAQSGLDSPEQREQAQAIVEECDRLTARINQFLAFARPCQPRLESVNVYQVVDELAVLLEPDLDAKNLTLRRLRPTTNETIQADRELLRQALFNLLQNAVQFAPAGGTVEVSLRHAQDGSMRIEVSDRGAGVPDMAVDSLFTPYFTTRSDGTGLGLAIVRRIAIAHGWDAGYTPNPGGGSIFWLDRIHA